MGRAHLWGTAECERQSESCSNFRHFSEKLRRVFYLERPEKEASYNLLSLIQNIQPITDYAIDFHMAAADSTCNEPALFDAFYQGLTDQLKDKLASWDLLKTLNGLIKLAPSIDQRLRAGNWE